MFEVYRKEVKFGDSNLIFETGKIARQADGAVLVTYGGTTVLCTAVASKKDSDADFFPLTVNYQEKAFAAGKIPGGFFKREGRPSEKETLVCRLIDRPIRPLFHKNFKRETQIIATVLEYDFENDPDIVAIIGASAALTISGLPFMGPLGACRVGWNGKKYSLNPKVPEYKDQKLDLVVAGTNEGVLMVESEACELNEKIMLGAVDFGHKEMKSVIKAIVELAEVAAKEPIEISDDEPVEEKNYVKLVKKFKDDFKNAYKIKEKSERSNSLENIKLKIFEELGEDIDKNILSSVIKNEEANIVRSSILKTKKRIDGRDNKTVRNIVAEVSTLPKAHGSALFTRGETQALVVATLGSSQDNQFIDGLDGDKKEHFLLHYNFPPYSVGEAGRVGTPGRREIGHGKLAWRAIHPLLPSLDDFPYTIRIVSEITESNGSSSMATVCGTSLALMDAGVPIHKPIAGIAMGLIKEKDEYVVLSDILGDEDHLGDMDFKVAGTKDGITSLQMDIKITSITSNIMKIALDQALEGRKYILSEMKKAISKPRSSLADNAPKIKILKIKVEKIKEIIGPSGKVIKDICESTNSKIDIDDDGTLKVASPNDECLDAAMKRINDIIVEPELGKVYSGKVVKTVDFGAFVNFLGNRDGLVHISELQDQRTEKTTDICKEGELVKVKVIGFDDRGKVKLSMKRVDQESGEDLEK